MNTPLSVRTDCYQIGIPIGCLTENCVYYISNPYASLCSESSFAQFGRNPLNQCTSRLLLILQLIEDDGVDFEEKMKLLSNNLREQMREAARLDSVIAANLKELGYGNE